MSGGESRAAQATGYTLRPSTDADFEFLCSLKKRTLRDYVVATWGEWDEEWQRRHFTADFARARPHVVSVDARAVGTLTVHRGPDDIFLENIGLLPEWQGRGLGSRIIEDVLAEAASADMPVRLKVLKVNPAHGLYRRLGFVVESESDTHLLMRWRAA